jgi:DNA end-binding protein Ku
LEAALEEARTRPYSAPPATNTRLPPVRPEEAVPSRGVPVSSRRPRAEEVTGLKGRQEMARRERARMEEPPPPPHEPAPPPPPIVNDRTIALDRFVRRAQIDPRYLDTPYYIAPRDEVGQEAFAVIRDAIRDKEMAGMGRVVLARRERPFIVEAMGDGMLGFTLRYTHEVRNMAEYFAEIPKITLPDEMLEVAERIIEMKKGEFDPAFLEDRYRTVLVEKLKEKKPDLPVRADAAASPRRNVIDLMAALKRSLTAERSTESGSGAKAKSRAAAAATKAAPAKRSRPRSR